MQTTDSDLHAQLLASRDRYRAVLNAALDCVIGMDHRGIVVEWNPAAERTFGWSVEEAIGRELAELIVPPALRAWHRRGLARYVAGGKPTVLDRRIEIDAVRRDCSEFPCELTITQITGSPEPVFVGYLRDITDRHAADKELRASRARIVTAADDARRRIERDLHDGAQQHLVGLALTLRLARSKLSAEESEAGELLDEALDDLASATDELRELARGIHPAVLTEGGLQPALSGLVRRNPVAVKLLSAPESRLPAPVEAAAYFVAAEGLTNVARHSGASEASVSCELGDGTLVVEVRDNGAGCQDLDSDGGSGLRGLSDRVNALGGSLILDFPAGGGTVLRAELPCAS